MAFWLHWPGSLLKCVYSVVTAIICRWPCVVDRVIKASYYYCYSLLRTEGIFWSFVQGDVGNGCVHNILSRNAHTRFHAHMHVCIYSHLHAHSHVRTHIWIHVHAHMHTYTNACMHTHADMHTHKHTHIHIDIYTFLLTHLHTHVHTHMHIHT